jgi:hypothetical protein
MPLQCTLTGHSLCLGEAAYLVRIYLHTLILSNLRFPCCPVEGDDGSRSPSLLLMYISRVLYRSSCLVIASSAIMTLLDQR